MRPSIRRALAALIFAGSAALLAHGIGAASGRAAGAAGIERIDHILVVYLENRSFDNLYGLFPGANGLSQAGSAGQVDENGKLYERLPVVMDTRKKPPAPDPRFPADLPNRPFDLGRYVPLDQMTGDMVHRFYQEQMQIDGGKMDRFVAVSDAGGLVMGTYDASQTELWAYAKKYVLADNFFHAAFGGSLLNHMFLVCVCAPRFPDAPPELVARLGPDGTLLRDGVVTPDGYAVNTIQTRQQPHRADADPKTLLPPLEGVTIGDRLSDKGVSWAWYAGGWDHALAGHPDELFQFHHQPFAYFEQFGDGTEARKQHLRDETDLFAGIDGGALPAVSFWKPLGNENEHPGYANVSSGDHKAATLLRRLESSPLWSRTVVIITYDENGGSWDHVAPPKIDRWGPGTRVPTLIVSPLAKRGFVDHTQYDTTSILKLIEVRYGLAPLGSRDAAAADLTNAFAF